MIIPKIDPLQFAVTELALPEVKSLAETILKKKEGADFSTETLTSKAETLPSKRTPGEVLQEMIRITTFEMMKSEIFFPEDDQEEEW